MANEMRAIQTITVGSGGAATIDFTTIPQTYTDLKIVVSARSSRSATEDGLGLKINTNTSGYTYKVLSGNGSAVSSISTAYEQTWSVRINGNSTTSNTFTNAEFYIPNYIDSTAKSYLADAATENNATEAYRTVSVISQSSTSSITSITLSAINGNLMQYSTATLYGVVNYANNQASAYATGGTITTDGTYWYHTFTSSGTFTPSKALTCDYLVVAGGGGSGGSGSGLGGSGGGGAGGYRTSIGSTPLAVTATNYTVTVGAGGSGGASSSSNPGNGTQGGNSAFGSITSTGGGYSGGANSYSSSSGGSGGGGSFNVRPGASGNAGGYTPVEGYAGGNSSSGTVSGGGGGGAGAVGSATSSFGTGGSGGIGIANSISGSSTYYAGGGGGGGYEGSAPGGTGGGGNGSAVSNSSGTAGTANTGGGAGGCYAVAGGQSGGSGIVIVRYSVNS